MKKILSIVALTLTLFGANTFVQEAVAKPDVGKAGQEVLPGCKNLTVKLQIDSVHVFGFDLTESRSAKGGIWNLETCKAVTPLNYTNIKNDTIDGRPVVKLYREVALGNHPLNGWETWVLKDGKWICLDSNWTKED